MTETTARELPASANDARRRSSARRAARVFISPATTLVLALSLIPLVISLGLTFTNVHLFQQRPIEFVGFDNWARLFRDEALRETIFNTVFFVGVGVALQYALGLALALGLNKAARGQRPLRVLFLLPMMVSPIAVGFIIGRMMLSESFGPVNDLLSMAGLGGVNWLATPWMARWTIVLIDTWQWTPLMMLLILAGLQGVPDEPLEAARVDGATGWQTFRYIIFPLILPVSITAVLIRALEAFKIIDIIRVVTGGGPGRATESVTVYVYDVGSRQGNLAYASAAAYALLILVIITTLLFLFLSRRATKVYE